MKTPLLLASLVIGAAIQLTPAVQAGPDDVPEIPQESQSGTPGQAPLPGDAAPYPEYEVSQTTERRLPLTPAQAAAIILDFGQQCKTCRYPVASVVAQEVFGRERDPYHFLVWQDVNKEIDVLVGKIPFKSSSWTEVRVYQSPGRDHIVIDSRLLAPERADAAAEQYERPSKPAFAMLHSRWVITALDPAASGGMGCAIAGVAGGRGQGLSAMVPKSVMRKELKGVLDETLDFVKLD